jgi:hypothetical protein
VLGTFVVVDRESHTGLEVGKNLDGCWGVKRLLRVRSRDDVQTVSP